MKEFYLTLKPVRSMYGHPGEFYAPWTKRLQGAWECALVEISMDCDFTPKSDRLYLFGDFLDTSYIQANQYPLLRNVEVRDKKYLTERYLDPRYVRMREIGSEVAQFRFVDDSLNPVTFESEQLHLVLHVRPVKI